MVIYHFRALWTYQACLSTPISWSNCSFDGYLTTRKKQIFYLKQFLRYQNLQNYATWLSRVFSVATQELDFSQPCCFWRFSKTVYHLKPKIHIDGPNLSLKSVSPTFFRALRHAWLNPKKITWSNCNFHELPIQKILNLVNLFFFRIFSWVHHFFILKKPKMCMKIHRTSIS